MGCPDWVKMVFGVKLGYADMQEIVLKGWDRIVRGEIRNLIGKCCVIQVG